MLRFHSRFEFQVGHKFKSTSLISDEKRPLFFFISLTKIIKEDVKNQLNLSENDFLISISK